MKTISTAAVFAAILTATGAAQTYKPELPRAWADKDVATFEVPLTHPDRSPRYISEKEHCVLPVRPIYRSYPAYAEGLEPAGYLDSLKQKEPEIIFDQSRLKTKEDWIRAGRIVFEADNSFFPANDPPGGQDMDTNAHFGDFQPTTGTTSFSQEPGTRFSDEQLYAMGLFIYSLEPPRNPNPFDDRAKAGQKIFQQQGCPGCHTPPLYTSNKLTPAVGFRVTDEMRKNDDILKVSVGTDPVLATQTRRGTGFYKVPQLKGVWFRNAFGHTGQADSLEEWFNPARLKADYVPKGYHRGAGPIQGHEFALKLNEEDRTALIAFLRTL